MRHKKQQRCVVIVGAGPSGLAALKEMLALGIPAIAIDSGTEIGGVFASDKSSCSVGTYENLYLTIPNMFMAFSDFPPEDTHMKYWTKDEYADYLHSYADHFGLLPYIHLNTFVKEAKSIIVDDNGRKEEAWQVSTVCKDHESVETCDFLIVATGANHVPHLPKEELLPDFTGEVIHTSKFTAASQLENKRVLVVGMGESAVDAAVAASHWAKSSTIWSQRFPDMAPRFVTEFMQNHKYDEEDFLKKQNQGKGLGLLPKDCLECITTSRIVRNLPLGIWGICLHGFVNEMKARHGPHSHGAMFNDIHENTWENDWFSADTAQVPNKSGVLYRPACDGTLDVVIAPKLRAQGNTVIFESPRFYGHECTDPETSEQERSIEVDFIVAATGYKLDFSWLNAPSLSSHPRTWFKHCFPPNLGHRLAFLGYARPHQGGIPQVAEMLARYVAQQLVGNVQLPENYSELAIQEGRNEGSCFHCMPHYELVVDYHGIMLSIASLMGCEPKLPSDVPGIVKHWTFPLWPCFFRTQGPGANPAACDAVLNKFGTFDGLGPMPLLLVEILFTFLTPAVNLTNTMFGWILDIGKSPAALGRGYKWRMSKGNIVYTNLKSFDAALAFRQLIAGTAMVWHLVSGSVISDLSSKAKIE